MDVESLRAYLAKYTRSKTTRKPEKSATADLFDRDLASDPVPRKPDFKTDSSSEAPGKPAQ
jgi:hypothetical protein